MQNIFFSLFYIYEQFLHVYAPFSCTGSLYSLSVSPSSFELLCCLNLSASFLFQFVCTLWTQLPKWNWSNPSLKYCSFCSPSYLVCSPSDDPFLISFFPSFSFHLCTFLAPLSPPAHCSCLSFLLFVYLERIQSSQREGRGLELRLWRVDLSHWCWL